MVMILGIWWDLWAGNNDYTSSNTNVTTIDTKVVISAPLAVFTKSMDIFTTGIPIHPVYIQAPSGNILLNRVLLILNFHVGVNNASVT
jgi:hypothetical protein